MDPFVLELLRAQLRNDALPADGVVDVYNSFRDAVPNARPDDSVVGFAPYIQACYEADASVDLYPDSVFHAVLTFFVDRLMNAPPGRYLDVHEHAQTPSYCRRVEDDDHEEQETENASPWSLSRERLGNCYLARKPMLSSQLLNLLTTTSFTTSNESARRAFLISFLSEFRVKLALSPTLLRHGSIPRIEVHGTGADWMQLQHVVDVLFRMFPSEVDDANLQERFHAAIRHVNVMRVDQREELLRSSYFYDVMPSEGASGWLLDLAMGVKDRMVVMFPYDRAPNKYVLVSALQNGRCFSESVVQLSSNVWRDVFFAKGESTTPSFRTYAPTDEDAVAIASHARNQLKLAIEQRDMTKAIFAHSKLPNGNEILLHMILDGRWDMAQMLADRLMVPAECPSSSGEFLPCDYDEVDEDDGGSSTEKPEAQEVLHSVSVQGTGIPSLLRRFGVEDSMTETPAGTSVQEVHRREFTIDALPRDSMLRLQRWALDEMIQHPSLDLTGLTTLPTKPSCSCFRVFVEVRDA